MPHGTVSDPHVFVSIDPSGLVTIIASRSEMGTGSRTSLPMVVADEMEADWDRVRVVAGARRRAEIRQPGHRRLAQPAAFRAADAAMRRGDADDARTGRGQALGRRPVAGAGGEPRRRRSRFRPQARLWRARRGGEQVAGAVDRRRAQLSTIRLKDPKDFRYIGTGTISIVDLHDITTGKAGYGIDAKMPGMKFAVIARPPVVGGKLVSFDASEALKVPGVEKVIEVQGWPWPHKFKPVGGVAVVARNTGSAIKGREKLKITWDDGPNATYDSVAYRKETGGDRRQARARSSATTAMSRRRSSPRARSSPPSTTCRISRMRRWSRPRRRCPWPTASASPMRRRRAPAAAAMISPSCSASRSKTSRSTPRCLGGGFGRKSKWDYVLEAALVSKAIGAPVKVTWTREDDLQHDFYHTVSVERIDAGIGADGKVMAWRHRSVAPDDPVDVQGGGRPRSLLRARHGPRRQPVRDPQSALRERARPTPIPGSAGSARSRTSRTPLRCSRWWRRSPPRSGATPRTCCWS